MRALWAGVLVTLLLLLLPSCGSSSHGVEVHGLELVPTKALPTGRELSEGNENTVVGHPELGFAVTIANTGDPQEEHVEVTLAIQVSPKPIVQTKSIDLSESKCRAAARAAVKTTAVRVFGLLRTTEPDGKFRVSPSQVWNAVCFDFTADGHKDIALTVESSGTAGAIAWVVLVRAKRRWDVAVTGRGYKVRVWHIGRELVVSQPIYKKDDANCCPSGGCINAVYKWQGGRFIYVRKWRTKKPPWSR